MPFQNIDHFQLVVRDIDRAVDFYQKLGLTATVPEAAPGTPRRAFLKVGDGQEIIVITPEGVAAQNRTATPGGGHFCLVWDGTEDELRELLSTNGVALRDRQPEPGTGSGALGKGTSIFVNDPSGNSVELIVYPERVPV